MPHHIQTGRPKVSDIYWNMCLFLFLLMQVYFWRYQVEFLDEHVHVFDLHAEKVLCFKTLCKLYKFLYLVSTNR